MRLGIKPTHGRPYHPQTRGKNERFNGTLAREGIGERHFRNLAEAQRRFDTWRHIYNYERPHQGIGDEPPASRFRSSTRRFPAKLPPIVYGPDCLVRRVQDDGRISWSGRNIFISNAFAGDPIGLRPTNRDGVFEVLYCSFVVSRLDLTIGEELQ